MPDPKSLKVGDRIRIIGLPKGDLAALDSGSTYLEEMVAVLRWMVGKEFTVYLVDEYHPWVKVTGYPDPDGAIHTMAIMDGDTESWEFAG